VNSVVWDEDFPLRDPYDRQQDDGFDRVVGDEFREWLGKQQLPSAAPIHSDPRTAQLPAGYHLQRNSAGTWSLFVPTRSRETRHVEYRGATPTEALDQVFGPAPTSPPPVNPETLSQDEIREALSRARRERK
jgi:hypothetical protein